MKNMGKGGARIAKLGLKLLQMAQHRAISQFYLTKNRLHSPVAVEASLLAKRRRTRMRMGIRMNTTQEEANRKECYFI